MNSRWQAFLARGSLALVLGAAGGCSNERGADDGKGGDLAGTAGVAQPGSGGATIGGGAASSTQGGETVVLPGSSGSGGGAAFEECTGTVSAGKLAPLDIFIMLDSSGSMLDLADDGTEKWGSVQEALIAFLSDSGSSGLGVGIQYFPQSKGNAPDSCTSDAQCPGDTGPCFQSLCAGVPDPFLVACSADRDCEFVEGDFGPCLPFGVCENGGALCAPRGLRCARGPNDAVDPGQCVQVATSCLNATDCSVATYQTPAVPIAELPGARDALIASLEEHEPVGQTPTAPALRGALEQTRAWAREHPDHSVVAVLATDGMPTECAPTEIPAIAEYAAEALTELRPSISTFVIGVFGPNDQDAQQNLDELAQAGGTEQAFIVDTSRDVTAQFLSALDAIRTTRLACEFQIPAPEDGKDIDFNLVNVQFTNAGQTTPLYFVGHSMAECDDRGGWYYDSDPKDAAPTRIIMCPSTCATIEAARDSSVEVQLGCSIRIH